MTSQTTLISAVEKLNAKIDDLRDFKSELTYDDRRNIEGLKLHLSATNEQINSIKIPAEIKVINENKISLKDKTNLFLIFSFSFAFLISIISVWYSNYRIAEADKNAQIKFEESNQNLIKLEDQNWFIKFYQYQSEKNPKDTKNFEKSNPM